ncbi:hypothetical protein GALMADRAFT_1030227 [Galerina marginata CBS 339.88]|uniref:Uncharacterized protein n=1 Tax=Galerina marginata (strain CBS 339.88) TaxID=685588 RepID=A0A067SCY0_GALM3|nr:hypothetical protein GALMADRAFT_1030227 [Galerina marginata CBS 339.88]
MGTAFRRRLSFKAFFALYRAVEVLCTVGYLASRTERMKKQLLRPRREDARTEHLCMKAGTYTAVSNGIVQDRPLITPAYL